MLCICATEFARLGEPSRQRTLKLPSHGIDWGSKIRHAMKPLKNWTVGGNEHLHSLRTCLPAAPGHVARQDLQAPSLELQRDVARPSLSAEHCTAPPTAIQQASSRMHEPNYQSQAGFQHTHSHQWTFLSMQTPHDEFTC